MQNFAVKKLSIETLLNSTPNFFNKVIAHYDGLPTYEQQQDFLDGLIRWDADSNQRIFAYAQYLDHDRLIKLLICTQANKFFYRSRALDPTTAYYKHLLSAYLALNTPFKTRVYATLSKILPESLQLIILEYALPRKTKKNMIIDDHADHKHENPEVALANKLRDESLEDARINYFLYVASLVALVLIGTALLIFAWSILDLSVKTLLFPMNVFVLIPLFASLAFCTFLVGTCLIVALVALVAVYCFERGIWSYTDTVEFCREFRLMVVGTLALMGLTALILGVFALIPPLAVLPSVLALTIASGTTTIASSAAIRFFNSRDHRAIAANNKFEEIMHTCAQETGNTLS